VLISFDPAFTANKQSAAVMIDPVLASGSSTGLGKSMPSPFEPERMEPVPLVATAVSNVKVPLHVLREYTRISFMG